MMNGSGFRRGDILVCSTGHYHKMCADSYNMLRFLYMGFMFNSSAAQKQWGEMVEFLRREPYRPDKGRQLGSDSLHPQSG